MKKIGITLLNCFFGCILYTVAVAQETPERVEIKKQLMYLLDYAVKYDKYAQLSDKYEQQKNEAKQQYDDLVRRIKYGANRSQFIDFLDTATGIDSLQYSGKKGYNYTYSHSLHSPRISRMPTLLEYYKVVKYSLFEMDKDELLPPKDVPFLRFKEW